MGFVVFNDLEQFQSSRRAETGSICSVFLVTCHGEDCSSWNDVIGHLMSTQSHRPTRVVAQVLCFLYHFFVFCVYWCRRWWSKTLTMVDSVWPALTNVLDSVCMHGG